MSNLDDPRVLFSAERTLLAWNRTSLSLIAFGFLVERSGLFLGAAATPVSPGEAAIIFYAGVAFILLGVYASVNSCYQYMVVLRSTSASEYPPGYAAKSGVVINIVVALLGLLLVAGMYFGHS